VISLILFNRAAIFLYVYACITLTLGRSEEHPVCKKLSDEVFSLLSFWTLEQNVNYLHLVQLMPLLPHRLLFYQDPEWFLVPAFPGCPGKGGVFVMFMYIAVCHFQKVASISVKSFIVEVFLRL